MMRKNAALCLLGALALLGCRGGDDVVDEPAECAGNDEFGANSSRSTAMILTADAFVDGTFAAQGHLCQGDTDWFAIELAAGQTLDFTIAFEAVTGDLDLLLEGTEGGLLAESATVRGDESLTYTATRDQTVYAIVSGRESSVENAYSLEATLSGAACAPDAFEPNDSGTEPSAITLGSHTDLTVCFGEDDWYEVPAVDGQVVSARLIFDPSIAELGATLYRERDNGSLQWMGASQEAQDGAELVARVSNDGPFLLHINRGAQTLAADYDLELDVSGEACSPDLNEPNDGYYSPTMLAGDTVITDQTICLGDNDYFQFDVANGEVINASLLFDHDEGDLALRIYELLDDGTIAYRTQSSTLTDNEYITYRPPFGGTFLMWVWPTRGSATGSYDLELTLGGDACIDDAFEPNNNYAEASPLAAGSYGSTTLCTGDDDWYSFTASNGQQISAGITFEHDDNDLGMQVYKANDDGTISYRSGSDTLTDDETVLYQPYDDGDFLLRVYRSRGTALATYGLDFQISGDPCAPDAYEPNDAYPEALPIAPGSYPSQTLCVGDADWYEIDAANGQLIDIDASFTHADNDLGISLYKLNDDGTITYRSGSNSLSNDEHITYRPFEDGKFLVYVYRTRGTTVANYGLDISVSGDPCVADGFEPNNAVPEAVALADGSYPGQTLCVGDADWYTVDAINGQLINASISFTHADNDLGLAVYKLNDDGTWSSRSGSNTLSDNEQVLYRPYDDGTFLIYVYRTRGTVVADYDLDVSVTGAGCAADAFEPNNHWTQTSPLAIGSHPGLTLCVGDDDWYDFSADNGQLISALATFSHAQNDLGIRIYEQRPDGTIISRAGADSLTDNEWALYNPYQDADFLLRVYRTRGTSVASYDLDFDIQGTGCISDPYEPNDHWLQAADISAIVGTGTAEPMTECTSDLDYYDLGNLAAGTVIDASIAFTHIPNEHELDLYVYRVNANNTVTNVRSSTSLTDNEAVNYTVPGADDGMQYVLYVNRVNGTKTASYDMLVDLN